MKKIWTKLGAITLTGVVVLNAFIPYATATDVDPTTTKSANEVSTEEAAPTAEFFTVENDSLDFGHITETGRSYTKEINIKNNTDKDVIIDASVEKYSGVNEKNTQMSDWVVFVGGVTHFSVPSKGSKDLSVRVLVPSEATAGSQYSNIVLKDASDHTVTLVAKIDIAGDDLKYGSVVNDAWIDPVRLEEAVNAHVTVKNTGTAGFTSTYQIKAKNFFGGDWVVLKEVSEEVFPGSQVEFTSTDNMGFGIFSVEQRVTFVGEDKRMQESLLSRTIINLPWWSLAIAGGVILFIILIIIVAKRRKKNKKNSDKMKRAEKKARKAEIDKIEQAEEDAIEDNKKAKEDEAKEREEEAAVEEELAQDDAEEDEIEAIAEQLDKAEMVEEESDADYDEEEAIPIKVTIKKSSKK